MESIGLEHSYRVELCALTQDPRYSFLAFAQQCTFQHFETQ